MSCPLHAASEDVVVGRVQMAGDTWRRVGFARRVEAAEEEEEEEEEEERRSWHRTRCRLQGRRGASCSS